jgi:hypothetical protein
MSVIQNPASNRQKVDAGHLPPNGEDSMSKTDTEPGTASMSSGSGDGSFGRGQNLKRKLMRYGRRALRHAKTSVDLTEPSIYETTAERRFTG